MEGDHQGDDLKERPLGELLKRLSEETSTLVRQELALAKAEVAEKGKKAGAGAGMFGAAGLLGLLALGSLTACFITALALVMDAWLASLIVTVAYGAVAGLLALKGKQKVKQATPPIPQQAAQTVKEDIQTVKEEFQWGKAQTKSESK